MLTRSLILLLGALLTACAYRPWAGNLIPMAEDQQLSGLAVADDGTVTFTQGRLEIRMRPMNDEELNRQYATYSQSGPRSTNPYTFGNSSYFRTGETPRRFTVFKLSVKNYEFPKVRLAGDMILKTENGREYHKLSIEQLDGYYRSYALGYRGIEYNEYNSRRDILKRSLFPSEDIFSGQEAEGFVVFEPLDDDVEAMTLTVEDILIRFDYRGDPTEHTQTSYKFKREIGRIYPDGKIERLGAK